MRVSSAIGRYGLAVVSVALALLLTLLLQHYEFRHAVLSLFLFAIALTAWYAGVGAAALSIVLSILCFVYFFAPPIYSFAFTVADVPAIVILVSFGVLITGFSAIRRRIERQLLDARDELQMQVVEISQQARLLNLTHDAILVRDMNGVIQFWNRGAEELYGWAADEATGTGTSDLLKTVFPVPIEQIEAEVVRSGRWEGELAHTKKNGTQVIVSSRWALQQDDDGAPIAIVASNNDITERKRGERARQELEEQWKAAFESNPTMYFIVGEAGEIVSVNAFGAEQLGYTVSELVGQPVLSVFYEPDRVAVQKHAKECLDQPGRTMRWEARKIRKDGAMIWVRETANSVLLQKRPVLLVVCEDITEQKRAEEALRRSESYLAEAQRLSKTGSWAYNPITRRTIYWSDEMFRIFGLSTEQGPSSGKFWQLVHPEDLVRVKERVEREAYDKKEYIDEYRIVLPDGTVKHILDIGHPVFNGDGEVTEFVGTTVDVTERKRAEETLRRSEAYLAEAQRLSHTGSWARNMVTGETTHSSDEHTRLYGFDPELGLPSFEAFSQRMHPEDLAIVIEAFNRASRERTDFEVDFRTVLPDNTIRYIHGVGHPVFHAGGDLIEYVGTAVDVSERKRAEQALRDSEELKRRIIESSTDCIKVLDLDGNLLFMSNGGQQLLEIDNIHPYLNSCWIDFWQPEDRARIREAVAAARAGGIGRFQAFCPSAKGAPRWWDVVTTPICNANGQPEQLLSVSRDITERKRAEQELRAAETRFRASVDHLTDALFIHDDQDDKGRVIDVNQQACDSLGYTREELIGMTAFDYDPSVDVALNLSIKERLARGETFSFESVHRRKDGTEFPVELRVRPFWHGDHRFGLALARDITDRKRAEAEREKLRQIEADLAHINRVSMMGELAASLAHEVKQPMAAAATNAKTSLRWLQREPPDIGEAREAVSRIVRDVLRAADIIDRNRSLYRKDSPKREMLNLNELIREMTALLHDTADRHSISIRAELDGALPATSADRVQMQQVLMNLMLNGIEAMKDTSGELTIRSEQIGDDQILLSVSDVGIGLPVENAEHIFDAFFTTKKQGTGMGLSICRRIIESHGGRLWVTANWGRGATFHFTVPTEAKVLETAK